MAPAGGSTSKILEMGFDPDTMTLGRLVELYVEKSGMSAGAGSSMRSTFNHPAFAKYKERPVIEFIESALELDQQGMASNPLTVLFDDSESSVNKKNKALSHVRNIEKNVAHQLKVQKKLGKYADSGGVPALSETVIRPDKAPARSAKISFDPTKMGEFQVKLLDYAAANPDEAHVVRAIFANMYLGFRPGEVTQMPAGALHAAKEGSVSPGIFIPPALTKMNAPINIPANPYVAGLISSQMQSNIGIGENVPDVMFLDPKGKPIPNGKITKVLQNIGEVDGILFDNETGKGINRLTSAYDLRRIFATAAFFKNYSLVEAGRAVGRPIKEQAGAQAIYAAMAPGIYSQEQFKPVMGVGTYYWEQLGKAMGLPAGDILAPDQDIVQAYIDAKGQSQIPSSALRSGPLADVLRFTDYEPLIDANKAIAVLPSPFSAAGEVIEGEVTDVTGRGPVKEMTMDEIFEALNEAIDEDNAQKALPAPEAETPPDDPDKPKGGGTGKKVVGAAATAAGIIASGAAKAAPAVGVAMLPARVEELQDRYGLTPSMAMALAGTEEAVAPVGIATAVGETAYDLGELAAGELKEAAATSFEEETNTPLTDRNLTREITSRLSGGRSLFSSGGFINKGE